MDKRDLGGPRALPHAMLLCAALLAGAAGAARAQGTGAAPSATTTAATTTTPGAGSDESLTVLGHHSRFQPAPMPGAPMGPPPDKPSPHLGRYKISGDQEKKDGYDTQTGAYIAPFGTAYTGASPVADGLAPRFGH